MAHLIIGTLSSQKAGTPFLISLKQLDKINSNTVARFINESLGTLKKYLHACHIIFKHLFILALLWPSGIQYRNVKLFVTDGASYMIKAGTNLKVFYENLVHLTCLAHALHLVCETIRREYPNVNAIISNIKKFF